MKLENYEVHLPSYSIGDHIYDKIGPVCESYGKTVLLIGGRRALKAAEEKIRTYVAKTNLEIIGVELYGSDCTYETVEKLRQLPVYHKADMVFGVGGGKALDTVKCLCITDDKPVFTFPTIASNCAACTSVSIMYNEDGIKLYDYGNGDNAGMERSLFPNSNALSDSRLNKQEAEGNAFNGTGYIDVTFLKDFKFTFNAGVSLDETRSTSVTNPWFGQFASEKGMVSKGHQRNFDLNLQQILNYTKQIGHHNLNVMLGHESYQNRIYLLSASKSNMLTQDNDELAGAIIDKQGAGSYRREYNNEGYFARVMYDYAGKYFASASFALPPRPPLGQLLVAGRRMDHFEGKFHGEHL